ncbi:MAG: glycosyltransferase family 39 protein [Candidatus Zixiibacteriota bacterium]|nr:MAG: glycosyltransferase family 39 protein [candidate division Zixibacteria bacterium]
MSQTRLSLIILALAVIFGTALRMAGTAGKKTIDPDEGISYMVATGHLGEYFGVDGQPPYGAWVEAEQWKRFLQVESRFCFKQIGYDLANYDIHPPLYFWLLHLWSLIFGIHLWTGPSLNILISVMAILLLYRLANLILKDRVEAALAAFVWALGSAVMGVSCHARPYDLLALCTILLTLQTIRITDASATAKSKDFIYMAITSAAGAMTHYHFAIIILGCSLFMAYKLIKVKRQRLFTALSSIVAGLVIFYLMHPHFLLSVRYQMAENQPFQFSGILPRLKAVITAFGTFFWQGMPAIYIISPSIVFRYIYPSILIILILFLSILYIKSRSDYQIRQDATDRAGNYVLYFLFWTSGIIVLGYMFFLSPAHALGPKYLSIVWPFFAFVPVLIIRVFGRFKSILMMVLIVSQIFFGGLDMFYMNYPDNKRPEPVSWLKESDTILIDNVARGVLPGIIWHVPDDKLVFAADQNYLIENSAEWKSRLTDNSLYLSILLYGNTSQRQREILDVIKQDYEVVSSSGGFWGYGSMFRLEGK